MSNRYFGAGLGCASRLKMSSLSLLSFLMFFSAPVQAADRFRGGWTPYDHPRGVADIDGDGSRDLYGFSDWGLEGSINKRDGTFAFAKFWGAREFSRDRGWNGNHVRVLADVNGDGKADIIGFGESEVHVSLNTGSYATGVQFGPPVRVFSPQFTIADGWRWHLPRTVVDIDGDTKADILGFAENNVAVSLSTSSGDSPSFAAPVSVGVFFCANNQGCGSWGTDHPRALGDVNGDGLTDIVGFGEESTYVALNTSRPGRPSFAGPVEVLRIFCHSAACGNWLPNLHPRMLADVNGDGKADIVGFGRIGVSVALSRPAGNFLNFDLVTPASPNFGSNDESGGWAERHPRTVADVTGDGRADIVGFGEAALHYAVGKADGTFDAPTYVTGVFTASASGFTRNWMSELRNEIGRFKLRDLSILGSHDAGTYEIPAGSLARNQALSIYEQLRHGARYLDFRAIPVPPPFGVSPELFMYHGVAISRTRINTCYDDLIRFLEENPSEIVILDQQHLDRRFLSASEALDRAVAPIRDRLITPQDIYDLGYTPNLTTTAIANVPLEALWRIPKSANNTRKQVILMVTNEFLSPNAGTDAQYLWSRENGMNSYYSDTGSWNTHYEWLDTNTKKRIDRVAEIDGKLWVTFAQLTPGVTPGTLASLYNDDLAGFMRSTDEKNGWRDRQLNITAFDFFDYPNDDIPREVIENNLVLSRGCLAFATMPDFSPQRIAVTVRNGRNQRILLWSNRGFSLSSLEPGQAMEYSLQLGEAIMAHDPVGKCFGTYTATLGDAAGQTITF